MRMSSGVRAVLPASLALALLAGCGPAAPPAPSRGFRAAPDAASSSLVLVTLDTFRADAAGCGGSPGARTPWLDRIARGGIQFRDGLAASPLTAPSHASILTGEVPPGHGVRDNGTFPLPPDVPTIATALRDRGFATGGFVAAFPLIGRAGFRRGFDVYDDGGDELTPAEAFGMAQRTGDRVAEAAVAWMRAVPAGRRFLAWVHFFDAHAPYEPPPPWTRAAGGDYAGDVAWTDDHLGRVVRYLERERPDAWIVLQADHGESLGQHGEDTHAIFVYDATIRVPALLWPAPRGERPGLREGVFRNVDVPATAFELLGWLPEAAPGDGVSVLSEAAGPAYSESLYPWFHYGWSELRAVREGRWTYVRAPAPELYDTEADPAQSRNLIDERPDLAAQLDAALDRFAAAERASAPEALGDAEREALESLGYVTDTAGTAPEGDAPAGRGDASGGAPLPDPKDMIRVQSLIYDSMRAMSAGRWDDARRDLQRALQRDPHNKEAHKVMGMLYAEQGLDDLAVDSFRQAMEVGSDADDDTARIVLAAALMRLGLYEEAGRHFEILAGNDPLNADAWFNHGQSLRAQDRKDEAIAAFRRALELKPDLEVAREALIACGGSE